MSAAKSAASTRSKPASVASASCKVVGAVALLCEPQVASPCTPIDGLQPIAASQILAWAIHAATSHPDSPLDEALRHAQDHPDAAVPAALPLDLPDPPRATGPAEQDGPDVLRRRVARAIEVIERDDVATQCRPAPPELGGDALT